MENEQNRRPPLRGVGNKVRDLYNTYVKNEEQVEHFEKQNTNETSSDMSNETVIDSDSAQSESVKRTNELEKENGELRDQALRRTAEMENMRRRFQKEKQESEEYANQRLLVQMLPIIDDLNNALDAARKITDHESLLKGIEMIAQKSIKIFEEAGVKPIKSDEGQAFDVEIHEALAHIPSQIPEGHIVREIQKGYMLRDKVLRYAKVVTSAGDA
ncbi:nucleotide exchange factor GrpE [Ignavibacteria bacterium]|jgi:molecular chaperone GrpE|nr:nucleotide exchange factor GrpE [Bacteroidota bacterium]MCZ2132795.1 nucleotide exchange factor GrpE [Bacteroidota bacterium]